MLIALGPAMNVLYRSFLVLIALVAQGFATESTFQSGPTRVHLLELYTSEGCSSCPPAERYFTTLKQNPLLWKSVVPVAFHVDYWDGLGWKDKLSAPAFTARQRSYAAAWGSRSVYTPAFVLDGNEWQERDLGNLRAVENVGILSASLDGAGNVRLTYKPADSKNSQSLRAYVVLLGMGLSSDVRSGENAGRKLSHDFAALAFETGAMKAQGNDLVGTVRIPADRILAGRTALAVWVANHDRLEPVQAVGGPL
jgi:hypothetical protein